MENTRNNLCADLFLSIPGLDQTFYLYREQVGRHITGISDTWYRPTYEAVYWSRTVFEPDSKLSLRSMTKLIFESSANVDEQPLNADEMLSAVPPDMMKYLIEVLSREWAVVTFRNSGGETAFTINFDKSELWEQEESECEAVSQVQDNNGSLSPYVIIRRGRAEPVPGSTKHDQHTPM